jgi:hypothetical protein
MPAPESPAAPRGGVGAASRPPAPASAPPAPAAAQGGSSGPKLATMLVIGLLLGAVLLVGTVVVAWMFGLLG